MTAPGDLVRPEPVRADDPVSPDRADPDPAGPDRAGDEPVRVGAGWLALREPADSDARAADLVDLARAHMRTERRAIIHDLGCGTGSMSRWLAPRLTGPQHWILHDRDADLLDLAAAACPARQPMAPLSPAGSGAATSRGWTRWSWATPR